MLKTRRDFLVAAGAFPAAWTCAGVPLVSAEAQPSPRRTRLVAATAVQAPDAQPAANQRVPLGWPAFAVPAAGTGAPARLIWRDAEAAKPAARSGDDPARLRISVALDVRDEKLVEVALGASARTLGQIDIRYAGVFQPFELGLSAADAASAMSEGLTLRVLKGQAPLWLFGPDMHAPPRGQPAAEALRPHLLFTRAATGDLDAFHDRLLSLNSIQMFGWMEGSVLDGLVDLAPRVGTRRVEPIIEAHLAAFFDGQGHFSYEAAHSRPMFDEIAGIEYLLPFGALARLQPQHPALDRAIAFCLSRASVADGVIRDDRHLSTEGAYTVAYPLAALARAKRRDDLALLAVRQLQARAQALVGPGAIHQRVDYHSTPPGKLELRNWARGVAWYLLGLSRSLVLLPRTPETAVLRTELQRLATWVMSLQRPDGLWACFIDDATGLVDTSGSAGIAAALALGARHGLLPAKARTAASRTLRGLNAHVLPDGFLAGAAQLNRGGERLQRSDYRVIFQTGMGLMAQLEAAL